MILGIEKTVILLLIIGSNQMMAQIVEYREKVKNNPVTYDKLRLEASIGVGTSKLHMRPYHKANPLVSPYAEIALMIPFTPRWRVRTGIYYQVVGSSVKYIASQGQEAIANRKLSYLSTQAEAGYIVSKLTNRLQIELQGGFFAAKQLGDVTVNRIPNQPVAREKSIDSSINYNYGIVSGFNVSTIVNQHNCLGIKLLYHQGLKDIRSLVAKQNTGELPTITRTFTFCTFFSI